MRVTKNSISLLSFLLCLLFLSCHDKAREQSLDEREQALTEKENKFALKEQDYESLLKMRDSLSSIKKADTITTHWPALISGLWSSKLLCIASSCNEYAVGDQKTNETWNFTSDSSKTLIAILNNANNALVRIYQAKYDSSGISLRFKTDSLAKRTVRMEVLLDQISNQRIKGTQTITIDSTCIAKFSVDLSRNK
jgi:hypothetical protein